MTLYVQIVIQCNSILLHFTSFLSLPSISIPFTCVFPSYLPFQTIPFNSLVLHSVPLFFPSSSSLPFPSLPLHLSCSLQLFHPVPCPSIPFSSVSFSSISFHSILISPFPLNPAVFPSVPMHPVPVPSLPFPFYLAPLPSPSLFSLIPSIISSQLRSVALSFSSLILLPCTLTAKLWLGPVLLHRSLLTIIHLGSNVI